MRVTNKIREKVLHWLVNGRVGMSSKFMACTIINVECFYAHPHDPADFNRCLLLLEEIPELKAGMGKLKGKSKQWDALLEDWDFLESCFINEVGKNWSNGDRAVITYKAMKAMGC